MFGGKNPNKDVEAVCRTREVVSTKERVVVDTSRIFVKTDGENIQLSNTDPKYHGHYNNYAYGNTPSAIVTFPCKDLQKFIEVLQGI